MGIPTVEYRPRLLIPVESGRVVPVDSQTFALRFAVCSLRFMVQDFGFGVKCSGFVQVLGLGVWDLGFKV